jgi:thiol:disulfide interchange protein
MPTDTLVRGENRDMRKIALAMMALGCVLSSARFAHAYLSSTWYEDASGYEEAVRQQKSLHVAMFVYFRVDWCPHCRAFDKLLEEQAVRSQVGSYVKVRINPEHGKAEKALFEQTFGTKGYPALFIVDSEGASPRRLSHGGPPERFVAQFPH